MIFLADVDHLKMEKIKESMEKTILLDAKGNPKTGGGGGGGGAAPVPVKGSFALVIIIGVWPEPGSSISRLTRCTTLFNNLYSLTSFLYLI